MTTNGFTTKSFSHSDSTSHLTNSDDVIEFTEQANTEEKNDTNKTNSEIDAQVIYIEKCIPNWKQTFPWVCWCSEDRVLYCLHCRELIRRYFVKDFEKSNVFHIASSEGIFSVAKTLRDHHDSSSHTAAVYLYSQGTLVSFVSLFSEHSREMKTEEEVMDVAKSMFDYTEITKDSLVQTIKRMGKYIENKLILSVKNSKYFSIVADQCRGILIVRWVNKKGEVVEHVIWSYLSVWDKTPMQYLNSFGLSFENTSLYIANSLCQYCRRCENVKVEPASLPPRPPSSVSFTTILWKLNFLRPLGSLVKTIYKLYKRYPYKFSHIMKNEDFKALSFFESKPICVNKLMGNFDSIKIVALDIYSKDCRAEALGITMLDLKKDEQHKKILALLQEIIDTTMSFSLLTKVSDSQIVKLNQAFSSLKVKSAGASFVTYGNGSQSQSQVNHDEKIWEFLNYVEKFIDEYQKSIYYNGKETAYAFINFFRSKSFMTEDGKLDCEKLSSNFQKILGVYSSPKLNQVEVRLKIFQCFCSFYVYLIDNKITISSCIDAISVFSNTSLQKKFPESYSLCLYCATMPFLNCTIPRSLFVSFITEQRLESSVWARMESDLKPWLLYLDQNFDLIQSKEWLTWWSNLTD